MRLPEVTRENSVIPRTRTQSSKNGLKPGLRITGDACYKWKSFGHIAKKLEPLDVGPQHLFIMFLFFFFLFCNCTFWIILYILKCGPTFPKTQSLDAVCPTTPIPHASILPNMSIFGVCWNKTVFLIEGLSWSPSWKVGTLEVTVLDLVSCPDTHQLWHRNLVA